MKSLIIALIAVLSTSCATFIDGPKGGRYWGSLLNQRNKDWGYHRETREDYVERNPKLKPEIKEAILHGELALDMTYDDVQASWGHMKMHLLSARFESDRDYGSASRWIYDPYQSPKLWIVLHFERGRLVNIRR